MLPAGISTPLKILILLKRSIFKVYLFYEQLDVMLNHILKLQIQKSSNVLELSIPLFFNFC